MGAGVDKLKIPRWIQLVALPLTLIAVWLVAEAVRHAIFIFLVSAVIAILLNPLVHTLTRMRVRRGFAVLVVYLSFATIIVAVSAVVGAVVVTQGRSVANTIKHEFSGAASHTPADAKVEELQTWLNTHGLRAIKIRDAGHQVVDRIRTHSVSQYTQPAIDAGQTIATAVVTGIINVVLVVVISIYMLLDAPRFSRALDRRFPPGPDGVGLGARVQRGLSRYVRGQATVSLVIGATVGVSMELLGLLGVWPAARQYAIFFFAWATVTELIPYVGPVLGALPPIVLALLDSPLTALWVTLIFVAIHQLEGHIVVPRVMGSALGAHPLAVIFTLLAGAELHGLFGALLALPLLAIGREIWLFFRDRVHLEPWPSMMLAGVGLDVSGQAQAAERPAGELPERGDGAT